MEKKIINKKFASLIICVFCYISICYSQTMKSSLDTDVLKYTNPGVSVLKVKNSPDVITMNVILDPKRLESLKLLTKDEFKKYYGDTKADNNSVITPIPGVKFINISQIFDKYKIDTKYRNYPVIIDRIEAIDSKTLIADEKSIDKVVVNKEKKYIEIITTSYNNYIEARKNAEIEKNKNKKKYELYQKSQIK